MDVNLSLVVTCAVLVGVGVYLLLERSLTRVLIGLVVLSNGVNLMFLVAGGDAGDAPIADGDDHSGMADPLPQALVLTAIVITLGTIAFLLAMAHRSWQLNDHDDVQDDVEDAVIRELALSDEASEGFELATEGQDEDDPVEEEA